MARTYDISQKGNFQGRNIPNLIRTPNFEEPRQGFAAERQKLFNYREKRIKPLKDDNPHRLIILNESKTSEMLGSRAPYLQHMPGIEGKPTGLYMREFYLPVATGRNG